jgi:signal transduction histidine kinase
MPSIARHLLDGSTYRRLLFVLSGLPLGIVSLVVLTVGWSLCVGFLLTPLVLVIPLGAAALMRGLAGGEAAIARGLLDVEISGPGFPHWEGRYWRFFGAMLGAPFWRALIYLLIRALVGIALGALILGLLAAGAALTVAPAWVPFTNGETHIGSWHPHTLAQSLVLIPIGLALLPATLLSASAIASGVFRPLASSLLGGGPGAEESRARRDGALSRTAPPGQALRLHAVVDATLVVVLVVIWALSSGKYFWPVWVISALACALAIHAWFVLLADRPQLIRRFGGSRALAGTVGAGTAIGLYQIAIWASAGGGYFWPKWPIATIALIIAIQALVVRLSSRNQAQLAERVETLETSRAGAVDAQESALRRIERDLHDGAQARLVALGMSLGMAEHRLAEDPARAGELLAEARIDAEEALRELRDLARGIHPPVLSDRGLEAAVGALATATPMSVTIVAEVPERLAPPVETAAYFVAAEAIANAAKHAHAKHLEIRMIRTARALELEVQDDGCGGANAHGAGLTGLRHRVEALDGSLEVTSPPGGPTTIRAEIPCE